MSVFVNYHDISSDSEEDEEYEKRAAESNRKAKLEMERLKAKISLEKKREELKKARLKREEEAKKNKELLQYQKEQSRRVVLDSLASLSEDERQDELKKLELQDTIKGVISEVVENKIIQDLVNAYIDEEEEEEDVDNSNALIDINTDVAISHEILDHSSKKVDNSKSDAIGDFDSGVGGIDIDVIDLTFEGTFDVNNKDHSEY